MYFYLTPKTKIFIASKVLAHKRRKCFVLKQSNAISSTSDHHRMVGMRVQIKFYSFNFIDAWKCAVNGCHCSLKSILLKFEEEIITINEYNALRIWWRRRRRRRRRSRPLQNHLRALRSDDSESVMATIVLTILLFRRSHMRHTYIAHNSYVVHERTHTHTWSCMFEQSKVLIELKCAHSKS